jgi:hypothetical protein
MDFVIPGFDGPRSGFPVMQSSRNPVPQVWIAAFAGMTEYSSLSS